MILTGENRRTGRKICSNVPLSTTNLTGTDLTWDPGLPDYRPVTNPLGHIAACLKFRINPNYIYTGRSPAPARSKAWVCGCSNAGTAGSNPAGGMVVCLL